MVSERTFTYMKAYKALGDNETRVIDLLFNGEFEGNCAKMAKCIGINSSNCMKSLLYLSALGIIIIEKEKADTEVKIKANGKKEINLVKKCYLTDNWSESLVEHYKDGHVTTKAKEKVEFIKKTTDNA